MSFLSQLGKIVNTQLGTGENTNTSFGGYSKAADRTAERSYQEDGFIRDIRPNKRSILYQQPDIYIVIKKKMFSSLVDNSNPELLEKKERILIAASKRLFQNKCKILSTYEKLTKIEKATIEDGSFNTFLAPFFLNLVESTETMGLFNLSSSTKSSIQQLRNVMSYSSPEQFTKWTTNDYDAAFNNKNGEGTGTFEITNVASVSTGTYVKWGSGHASLNLEDPYNILTITEADIDQALSDVTNPARTGSFFKFTTQELQKQIDETKTALAIERRAREASQITFKISQGTLISKRVRAIFDNGNEIKFQYSTGFQNALSETSFSVMTSLQNIFSTGSVNIDAEFIRGNTVQTINQNDQLSPSELKKFIQIISDTFTLLDQNATSQVQLKERSADINYARNRMRLFFNGKYMLQSMDVISIFMTSRTGEDERMPGGYNVQSKNKVQRKFDTILKNIDNQIKDLKSTSTSLSFDDIERISTVGPDFPKWLWRQFKQDITGQPTGPCIFSGIVKNVEGTFSNGKSTVNAECVDNTYYFDMGLLNYQPSAEIVNASIYDPLTPFDISLDAATGVAITDVNSGNFPPLLPENQKLLLSGITTFKNGPEKGNKATLEKFQKPNKEVLFNELKNVLYNTDGMVYRWKQGIQTLTKTNRPYPTTSIEHQRDVLITHSPFAGQDVMNVISLLVTGQPYNYNTFLKAAIKNGNSLASDKSNLSTSSYIQGLMSDIEKRNKLWGNFIPYKQLVVNTSATQYVTQTNLNITTINETLQQKLKERAKLEDDLILAQGGIFDPFSAFKTNELGQTVAKDPGSSFDTISSVSKQVKINELSNQITDLQNQLQKTIESNPDIGITLIGNDVSATNPSTNTTQNQRDQLQLRQNLSRYTARRFWQVKANQDPNLFIVDDQYDTNYDILAFERSFGVDKLKLLNSHYGKTSENIGQLQQLLGLEIFANTQGHIQVRPPAYNKMPSSVFYKMFKDKDSKGIKVFPDFLESLYQNQIKGIFNQLEIIEDEIRLHAVALGANNDADIKQLLRYGNDNRITNGDFIFLTKFPPEDGRIGTNLNSILSISNPDFETESSKNALTELNKYETSINNLLKINRLFDTSTQVEAASNFNHNISPDQQSSVIELIRNRLKIKTGREAKTLNELFGNDKFRRSVNSVSQTDRINIFSQISGFISERQTLLKSVSNAIRNLKDGFSANSNSSSVSTPFLYQKSSIPEFLEHMLEYEDEDDIGPGSGRRFVLTPDRIVSLKISEKPPPYTMVTVNGLLGEGLLKSPGSFEIASGGNAITSAFAVDYDMWYQYGFIAAPTIHAPFFSDPDSQCAPFAVSQLIKCRENIFQGTCEVCGYNEYYQQGDTVYIEHKGLLFYVDSVSHSISYGKLTTTLNLTYGHNPGEYIPTMLDVVGKILYNSKGFSGQFRNERYEMLGLARSIGAIAVEPVSTLLDGETAGDSMNTLLSGRFGERNKNVLSNVLYSVSGSLNQINYQNKKSYIKIVYYISSTSDSSKIQQLVYNISSWLISPEQATPSGLTSLNLDNSSNKQKSFGINKDDIIIEMVNLDTQQRTRISPDNNLGAIQNQQGPSQAAINLARNLDVSDSDANTFKNILANGVIDIFVDYETIKNTISQTNGVSQADQAANSTINTAKNSRI